LIWDTAYESSLSVLINSLCILLATQPFRQRNFITNLCSAFSIYRRECILDITRIENDLFHFVIISAGIFMMVCLVWFSLMAREGEIGMKSSAPGDSAGPETFFAPCSGANQEHGYKKV
jgi:hypothetical protein